MLLGAQGRNTLSSLWIWGWRCDPLVMLLQPHWAVLGCPMFRALFPVEPICSLFCAWLWRWRWGLDLPGEPRRFSGSASQLSLPTAVGAEWWHQRPRFLCLCSSTELSVECASSWSQGESCSSRQPVVMSGRWGEMSNDLFLRRFVFYSESPANILGRCVRAKSLQPFRRFVTPWTVAHQAPLSLGFSRQEDWSWLPCPYSAFATMTVSF